MAEDNRIRCACGELRSELADHRLTVQPMSPVTAYALRVPMNDPDSFLRKPCELLACRHCGALYAVQKG